MKSQFIGLAMVGLMGLSTSALAQVTLNIGDNTVVTAINGQEVQNGLFSKPASRYTLEPGKHVITAKYTRLYELNGDNHDVLRSNNVSIPVELADNQTYTLVMAGQPEAYAQAKDYAKQPTLALLQNGQTLVSQKANAGSNAGLFGSFGGALGGIFGGGSKAVQSNQQTINALQGSSANAIPAIQPTAAATPVVTSTDTLDQFMQLWLKATPAERDKIRQWIGK